MSEPTEEGSNPVADPSDTVADSNVERNDEDGVAEGLGDEDDEEDGDAAAETNHHKKKNHKHRHKHRKGKAKRKTIVLFVCDPQSDYLKDGAMPIPTAKADGARLGDMINAHLKDITEIYVSLNSRHKTHITNPISWVTEEGIAPNPYTVITKEEVVGGVYRARLHGLQDSFLEYVTALEMSGRDALVLWPDHCLVGTEGHAVIPEINESLQEWAGQNLATVEYIIKATSCATEM